MQGAPPATESPVGEYEYLLWPPDGPPSENPSGQTPVDALDVARKPREGRESALPRPPPLDGPTPTAVAARLTPPP